MESLCSLASLCTQALSRGGRVLFCGNGGSAADAQHLAAELSGRYLFDRPPLDGQALHCNSSYLTAVANDYGYDVVFERQVRACARAGDVLIGLSTSGRSGNILKAFEAAREIGCATVAFTGAVPNSMADAADIALAVPSSETPRIQECHILLGHILCELIENEMFGKDRPGQG